MWSSPIPTEYAMDLDYITENIQTALEEGSQLSIHGKEITSFLLDKIQMLTHGKSLEANIQLVYNNSKVAALIAVELAAIR